MSLQRTLLLLIATVLLAGLVPAGLELDRRLALALEEKSREDLALAPRVMADRSQARGDVLMMHAKDLAGTAELADALVARDHARALRLARRAGTAPGEEVVLVGADGRAFAGPAVMRPLVEATREGKMPVAVVTAGGDTLQRIALAPVHRRGAWVGAVGVATRLDQGEAGVLSGLTRSSVIILGPGDMVAASTASDTLTRGLVEAARRWRADGKVRELRVRGRRWLLAATPLDTVGTVLFARDLDVELAVLPELRRVAASIGALALLLSLALGALVAAAVGRPVRALAAAADRLAAGDFTAPLERSRVREVHRVAQAFDDMRRALAARLDDLRAANRELADRQARLTALQAELIQRDRLAATGRLVAQLAHEIRNPVANVRNLLELIRRRVADDPDGRQFADIAIDELLRMHELAEQMLDLHRPRDPGARQCDAAAVAAEVVALTRAGAADAELAVTVRGEPRLDVAIAPDALKQVLVNLVQNAREAMRDRGRIEIVLGRAGSRAHIDVLDDGPGIPAAALPRIFDPFFTTKGGVQGIGLGLYVAEGIVRTFGGRISAVNRSDGTGAQFRVELALADPAANATPADARTSEVKAG